MSKPIRNFGPFVVQRVERHPTAPHLNIVSFGGSDTTITQESYKPGDTAYFIPAGCVLPKPLLQKIGFWDNIMDRGALNGPNGATVTISAVGNVLSYGIIVNKDDHQYLEGIKSTVFIHPEFDAPRMEGNNDTKAVKTMFGEPDLKQSYDIFESAPGATVVYSCHTSAYNTRLFGKNKNVNISTSFHTNTYFGCLRNDRGCENFAPVSVFYKYNLDALFNYLKRLKSDTQFFIIATVMPKDDKNYWSREPKLYVTALGGSFLGVLPADQMLEICKNYKVPTLKYLGSGPYSKIDADKFLVGTSFTEAKRVTTVEKSSALIPKEGLLYMSSTDLLERYKVFNPKYISYRKGLDYR